MRVEFRRVDWPFASAFKIAYRTSLSAETILVELSEDGIAGRGEAMGVSYHGETVDVMLAQLTGLKKDLERGVTREDLYARMPAGGARNAVDCALWDLEAKRTGRRVWDLAGIPQVRPLRSAYTLSVDSPGTMSRAAAAVPHYPLLKLKLSGAGDVDRVTAVRQARPDAELIVDANQAWNEECLREFTPKLARLGVKLIEQPLPAGKDDALSGFSSPVPICADESCQTVESLAGLESKYDYINIKLDKTGGLTEALRLARVAEARGLKLMVGCMAGTSLGMAPAFVVGQLCSVIDLDGPLLSASDVLHGIRYEGSVMGEPERALWG